MQPDNVVAIVSHDAGGAEVLSNWITRQSTNYFLVLDGPAKSIFERNLGQVDTLSLTEAIERSDWVLTGTSWQSDIEVQAIKLAKQKSKKTVSFLDHWVNYQQRFMKDGQLILPDEIWVGDENAFKIATNQFPNTKVILKPNPYFENIRQQVKELDHGSPTVPTQKNILYVCSPIREHAKLKFGDELYWGFTEEDAVRYFMDNVHHLNHPTCQVNLRPHPSEKEGKYNWATKKYTPFITIGGQADLLTEIVNSDTVVGYNSMAMVIGLIAGKRIINALPPGKITNTLPMSEIEQLSTLIENSSV